jgi:beta-exotoxin I transport system permease protein
MSLNLFGNVFVKTLRDQRRGLLGWSLGIAFLVFVEASIWPTMRDTDWDELLQSYPEELRELFDLDAMTTGAGFMNAELFTLLLPALFIVYAVARGARLVAGEEEAGTLDVLLVTPVSGARIVLQKALALVTSLGLLGVVLFAVTLGSSALFDLFDLGIGAGAAATGSLSMVLMGAEYGAIALAVGVVTGRRAWAIAVGTVAAVAAYVLYAIGAMVGEVEPWRPLSPFHQALEGGPLGAGLPLRYLWLVAVAVAAVLVAMPVLDRRDIAAHA